MKFNRIVFVYLMLAGVFVWPIQAQEWEQQTPFPTDVHLYAIDFIDGNTGWMTGDQVGNGEIWKTTDAGATWERQYFNSFRSFKDIEMYDANIGWAIGDRILKTTDGGTSWTQSDLPQGVQAVRAEFFSPTVGYLSTRPSGLTNYLYRTDDGGASWQHLGDFYVGQWDFADQNVGWAVDQSFGFVRTNDGGQTWQSVPMPSSSIDSRVNKVISYDEAIVRTFENGGATFHHTYDGGQTWMSSTEGGVNHYFLDSNVGWGLSQAGFHRTMDGGLTWTLSPHFEPSATDILPLDEDSAIAVGSWGYIIRTDDGGVTWNQLCNGTGKDLYSIGMANANQGWAVGDNGALLRTENGGQFWQIQVPPPDSFVLGEMHTFSPQRAVVQKGTVPSVWGYIETTDGGATWNDVDWPIGNFRFLDDQRGAVITFDGQTFYWTEDSGQNWETRPTTGIVLTHNERLLDIFMIDDNLGWTVGFFNRVYRTTDGGNTWEEWGSPRGPSPFNLHVRFSDANHGWIAGYLGTVYYTNDGGQIWRDRSLWNDLDDILDLHVVGPTEAYIIGGYSGANPGTGWFRKTTDAGLTWSFIYNGREGFQGSMSMVGDHIWTVGLGGTIHHFGPESELALITDVDVRTGALLSGGINELNTSDDAYLRTRSGFGSTLVDLHHMELAVHSLTTMTSPTALDLTIENRSDQPTGAAQIRLRNWTTGNLDVVGNYALGPNDTVHNINDVDATDYVNGAGEIEVSVKHIVFKPFLAFTFESFIDQVMIEVR